MELSRCCLVFHATANAPAHEVECILYPEAPFAILLSRHAKESLFWNDNARDRVLSVCGTDELVPSHLVSASLSTVRSMRYSSNVEWRTTTETQFAPGAHNMVELTPSEEISQPDLHMFEIHEGFTQVPSWSILAHTPAYNATSNTFAVIIQNMSIYPAVLNSNVLLLTSTQVDPEHGASDASIERTFLISDTTLDQSMTFDTVEEGALHVQCGI